jgi:hypothetical protein
MSETRTLTLLERIWELLRILWVVKQRGGKWTREERDREMALREMTEDDVKKLLKSRRLTLLEMRKIRGFHVKRPGFYPHKCLGEAVYDYLNATDKKELSEYVQRMRILNSKKPASRNPPPPPRRKAA